MVPMIRLTNGCSVRLTGRLVRSPGSGQHKELVVDECDVVGRCDSGVRTLLVNYLLSILTRLLNHQTYPIQKQSLSIEHLRDNVHLRARTDTIASVLRVRDGSLKSFNDFFNVRLYFNHDVKPLIADAWCRKKVSRM
jgi:asparaginyl-tRNA synthetase